MTISTLVSVDPGANTGIAFWTSGRLAHVFGEDIPKLPIYAPVLAVRPDFCICEVPRAYPGNQAKADPNDLIVLSVRVGMLVQRIGARETRLVVPSEWKGQLPKEVCETRIRGILDATETATMLRCLGVVPKGERHNLWDAVGIGLYQLGRFNR